VHVGVDDKMQPFLVTEDLILKKLSKLKINKLPGTDYIHHTVLYEVRFKITKPLRISEDNQEKEFCKRLIKHTVCWG